jgi:predicted aspartyl protease
LHVGKRHQIKEITIAGSQQVVDSINNKTLDPKKITKLSITAVNSNITEILLQMTNIKSLELCLNKTQLDFSLILPQMKALK